MRDAQEFLIRELLEEGAIDDSVVDSARQYAAEHACKIAEALISIGAVTSRELAIARSVICESPFVDLACFDIDYRQAEMLPRGVAEKHQAFPLFRFENAVTIGMADPMNLKAVDQVRQLLRVQVNAVLCEPDALRELIARAYSLAPSLPGDDEHEIDSSELTTGEEPLVAAVNQILSRAIDENASDVHINPDESEMYLRYRIDGVLQQRQGPGLAAHAGLVQRLKVMAHLDLTQTRRPQDGKFRFLHREQPYDMRMSLIPTVCGENVVMRILRHTSAITDFEELGVPSEMSDELRRMIIRPHGMILVTGPTGSGKTTTLYTALAALNSPERNIMTIEDPVEIRLPMLRQTQVNPEIGLTFAGALRSILRQDPDVILVGEIRDEETAQIAVQASLTGHLVLSTLHTNDAVGAVARLRDFGIPSFAINSALLGVAAQRLVRRICSHCGVPYEPDDDELRRLGLKRSDAAGLRRGEGCSRCMNTGYRGRTGVYELLRITPAIQGVIEAESSTRAIREAAVSEGMRLMFRDGLDKARLGLTTLEELMKVRATLDEMDDDKRTDLRMTA